VLGLILFCMAALASGYVWHRSDIIHDKQSSIAELAATGAAHEIRTYIDELHRALRVFAYEKSAPIQAAAGAADDEALKRLEQKLNRAFPEYLGFAASDAYGEILIEDFSATLGEPCLEDMRRFLAQDPGAVEVYIHPMDGAYHFDLIVPWSQPSGGAPGALLVSFRPTALTRILRNASLPGYELLLAAADAPYRVEISRYGTTDQWPESYESPETFGASGAWPTPVEVPGTRWQVVPRLDQGVLSGELRQLWVQLAIMMLVVGGLLTGLFWAWSRQVANRRRAEERLRGIADAVSRATGDEFFRVLVRTLVEGLSVRFAFVAEADRDAEEALEMRALCDANGRFSAADFSFQDSPCERVFDHGSCVVESHVGRDFPDNDLFKRWGVQGFIGVALKDSEGVPLGLLAILDDRPLRDVGHKVSIVEILATRAGAELERLGVQRALQDSEANYRHLVETSRDLIWSTDANGHWTYLNQAALGVFGYPPSDLLGRGFKDFIDEDRLADFGEECQKVLWGQPVSDYEIECVHKTGLRKVLRLNARPRYDDQGKVIGVTGTGTDITDIVQAQKSIRDNSELFSAILSKLPVFFFRIDGQGVIGDIRGHGLRRLELADNALRGLSIYRLFAGEEKRIRSALHGGISLFETEASWEGRSAWFTSSVFFDSWRGEGAVGFSIDVTERKLAEEKLVGLIRENRALARRLVEVQEDERTRLSRELHDELGQSITAVKSLATAIARLDGRRIDEIRGLGGSIIELSGQLYDVVKNIMHRLRPDVIDSLGLEESLRVCVDKSQLEITGIGVTLDVEGDLESLSEVVKVTTYRIVQECLTNISKYAMASNVYIKVHRCYLPLMERRHLPRILAGSNETSQSMAAPLFKDTLVISVTDDGVGMDIRRALDKEDKITHGLGLQGIKERVTALGGRFDVFSEAGRGVRLSITIDLETHAGGAEARSESATQEDSIQVGDYESEQDTASR
jgi:PAS domain S-box-containing protein